MANSPGYKYWPSIPSQRGAVNTETGKLLKYFEVKYDAEFILYVGYFFYDRYCSTLCWTYSSQITTHTEHNWIISTFDISCHNPN